MAEVLIRLGDTSTDAFAWQRLYPVAVFEDGHQWGTLERPPAFLVVRITDMTATNAEQYLDRGLDLTIPSSPVDYGLRKWKFDIDDTNLPTPVKKKIAAAIADTTGNTILEVTSRQINAYIKRTR